MASKITEKQLNILLTKYTRKQIEEMSNKEVYENVGKIIKNWGNSPYTPDDIPLGIDPYEWLGGF